MSLVVNLYDQALDLFAIENFTGAEAILTEIVLKDRYDIDALNFLGVVKLHQEKFADAIGYFQLVLELIPFHTKALYNSGFAYQNLSEYKSAINCYKCLLELEPDHLDALNNLGVVYKRIHKLAEAEQYFYKVLEVDPKSTNALINLGKLKFVNRDYNTAIVFYKLALRNVPLRPDINYSIGTAFLNKGDSVNAFKYLKNAFKLKPSSKEILFNIVEAFVQNNINNNSIQAFDELTKIVPLSNAVTIRFVNALIKNGKYDEAINIYDSYFENDLDKDIEPSPASFNKIEGDKDTRIFVLTELGVVKMRQGLAYEAIELWEKAQNISSRIPELNYNLAHAKLLLGNFTEGWQNYEWRKKKKEFIERTFDEPELIDQDVRDKTILVYDEQGLGDSIQFVRYLRNLKEKGAEIIFQYDKRLAGIFKDIKEIDTHIPARNFVIKNIHFDYHISLLSLPKYFKTDIKSIPCKVPYLFPDETISQKLSALFKKEGKFNIGIAWSGNPENNNNKNRSCHLSFFSEVCAVKNVQLISLQKGKGLEQLAELNLPIINLEELGINTFAHNAAIINNLDLVISVDTSIAHLSGALGRPTWILLSFLPDWRWMLNRNDSPWYPSVKLFRQKKPNEWKSVFDDVMRALKSELSKKNKLKETPFNYSSSVSRTTGW
jgi:tetratricopeptide (TPR) repeat protein